MQRKYVRYPLILLIACVLLSQITPAQDKIEVPEVVDLSLGEAWSILNEKGLSMAVVPELNTRYQPGTVFEQSPAAGNTLPAGSSVTLKVATGVSEVEVPDVLEQSREKARDILQNKRLSTIATLKKTTEYANGTVFEQEPLPGKKVPVGTPVRLSIADVPQMVEVPVLVGRPLGEVRAILDELDLSMGAAPELTTDHSPGTVFKQNPPPGTRVPITTPVYLAVATASDLTEVPNLTGQTFEEAWKILQDVKLAMVADPAIATEYIPGSVIGQSVSAGSKVPVGTPITLKIATAAEEVALSDFKGQSFEEAQVALRESGLPVAITTEITTEYKPGTIIAQNLTSGSVALVGTPVYIKVATAPGMVAMPNLSGQPLAIAQAMLQTKSLPMAVTPEVSADHEPGTVFAQNPLSGNEVHIGAPVRIKVATGPENVEVPNLTNRSLEETGVILQERKLSMVVTTVNTAEYPPGTVTEQNISAGSRVSIGTPVYLKVALGTEEIEVPNLLGRPLDEARSIIIELQLPMVLIPEAATANDPGTIFEQSLPPGTPVPTGTPIFLKTATDTGAMVLASLIDLPLEEVRKLLQETGLQLVLSDSTTNDYPPGTVLGQIPLPGSKVEAGGSVYVTVAVPPEAIKTPGHVARIPEEPKGLPGLIYFVAGIMAILGIAIVSLKVLKRKKPSDYRHPKDVEIVEENIDGRKIDIESEVRFETVPDIGRQYVEENGPLIMPEEGRLTAETESPARANKPDPQDKTELPEIQQLSLKIEELLEASNITTFGKLAKALNVKIRLKAVPDLGRQYLQTESSLILKETDDLSAGSETGTPGADLKSEVYAETGKIQENGREITDILRSSNITTFAQLAATLKFKIDLKPFPDAGKQSFRVKGSLIAKDNLKRIEGIGPKISQLLLESGIMSFAQLAATDGGDLREILNKADLPYIDPSTWPEQAKLAAEGRWEALKSLQKGLKGGRRV